MERSEVVINEEAGTVRSLGVDQFVRQLCNSSLSSAKITVSKPRNLSSDLQIAFDNPRNEAVVVGGGDGTISFAGRIALNADKVLGVLPLGTMNLFARALGMPLDVETALDVFSDASTTRVDVGEINNVPFFNHASIGLHPQLIKIRDEMPDLGRISKLANSARALLRLVSRAKRRSLMISTDKNDIGARASLVFIAVNPIPNALAQLPIRAGQSYGKLGIYISTISDPNEIVRLAADLAVGRWSESASVTFEETEQALIASKRSVHVSIDGEVELWHSPIDCRIRPQALKVLTPKAP